MIRDDRRWRKALLPYALLILVAVDAALGSVGHLVSRRPLSGVASVADAAVLMACAVGALLLNRSETELRQTAKRAERDERIVTTMVAVGDGMPWELDVDGSIRYVSPRIAEIVGCRPEELIGSPATDLVAPGERGAAVRRISEAAATGTGWSDEPIVWVTHDHHQVELLSSGVPHRGPDGRVLGFTGSVRLPERPPERGRLEREASIRRLISTHAVTPVFQPIMHVASREIAGYEALSRFPGEPGFAPDRWFDDAARLGLGPDLELVALGEIFRATVDLPSGIYLSVNASPATLLDDRFPETVAAAGWSLDRLVIEITERVSVDDYDDIRRVLAPLQGRGARLAVDDAGAGYASFQHILRLRPDYIKLDRGLISGVDADPGRRALLAAVTSFAHEVGACVIAEGIESASELRVAGELNVDFVQGYYIGLPASAETTWLGASWSSQAPRATEGQGPPRS